MAAKKNKTSLFPTTSWSLVIKASDGDAKALEKICLLYSKPIYLFIRSYYRSMIQADAENLTQQVFLKIFEDKSLSIWKTGDKSLRIRLINEIRKIRKDETQKKRAKKRGGNIPHVPFDIAVAETEFLSLENSTLSAEEFLDYFWAQAQIEEAAKLATNKLPPEIVKKPEIVKQLICFVIDKKNRAPEGFEKEIGKSRDAFKKMLSRLRKRFRTELRNIVADTVGNDSILKQEMVDLYGEEEVEKFLADFDS